MEDEEVRKLAEIKSFFEKRANKLENEVSMLRSFLDIIDKMLTEKSFKKIEVPKTKPITENSTYKEIISIKAADGTHLADMKVDDKTIKLVPNTEINFDINSPPFKAFLINRIFDKMRAKDVELAKEGTLDIDKVFTFKIEKDDGILKETIIENYGDERRLFELRNAVRWTLRRIYENMTNPSNQSE